VNNMLTTLGLVVIIHYHSIVGFHDSFYGICTGVVEVSYSQRPSPMQEYEVDATCDSGYKGTLIVSRANIHSLILKGK